MNPAFLIVWSLLFGSGAVGFPVSLQDELITRLKEIPGDLIPTTSEETRAFDRINFLEPMTPPSTTSGPDSEPNDWAQSTPSPKRVQALLFLEPTGEPGLEPPTSSTEPDEESGSVEEKTESTLAEAATLVEELLAAAAGPNSPLTRAAEALENIVSDSPAQPALSEASDLVDEIASAAAKSLPLFSEAAGDIVREAIEVISGTEAASPAGSTQFPPNGILSEGLQDLIPEPKAGVQAADPWAVGKEKGAKEAGLPSSPVPTVPETDPFDVKRIATNVLNRMGNAMKDALKIPGMQKLIEIPDKVFDVFGSLYAAITSIVDSPIQTQMNK